MSCIYRSLAKSYAQAVRQTEDVTGRRFTGLHIVGGGAKDWYLNRLTAQETGLPVSAGPYEATAVGNLLAQMLSAGLFRSAEEARRCVRASFDLQTIHRETGETETTGGKS